MLRAVRAVALSYVGLNSKITKFNAGENPDANSRSGETSQFGQCARGRITLNNEIVFLGCKDVLSENRDNVNYSAL